MKLELNAKKILKTLLLINLILIIMHLISQFMLLNFEYSEALANFAFRFNMDVESSVPTWFAIVLLFSTALLLLLIGLKTRKKKQKKYWLALSAVVLYMSIDEASVIHELMNEPMQQLFGITSGPLFFAWIIPFSLVVLIVVAVFAKFYWSLDRKTKLLFALAVSLFILGAIGVEMISAAHWQSQDFQYDYTYRILNAFEEGLENFGTITAIYALSLKLTK